jgi:hypothetical protein
MSLISLMTAPLHPRYSFVPGVPLHSFLDGRQCSTLRPCAFTNPGKNADTEAGRTHRACLDVLENTKPCWPCKLIRHTDKCSFSHTECLQRFWIEISLSFHSSPFSDTTVVQARTPTSSCTGRHAKSTPYVQLLHVAAPRPLGTELSRNLHCTRLRHTQVDSKL